MQSYFTWKGSFCAYDVLLFMNAFTTYVNVYLESQGSVMHAVEFPQYRFTQ